jgi:type I restriction enzyme S subunit
MGCSGVVPLKEVVEILSTGISEFNGKKKYITTGSVQGNKIKDSKEITYKNRPSRANLEVEQGCILFAKAKNSRKILLIDKERSDYIYSTGFFGLKPKKAKILPDYLFHYLNFNEILALRDRLAHGATQRAINNSDLYENFNILLPDIPTQKNIVSKLNILTDIMTSFETQKTKIIDLLANTRENIFSQINNQVKFNGLIESMYRYPSFYGIEYQNEGIPVIKISNISEYGELPGNKNEYDKITQEVNARYPKTIVSTDDIIMEVRGTYIGKCALVPPFLDGANISPNTIKISLDTNKIIPKYLWHFTFTNLWKSQIEQRVNIWKEKYGTIKSKDIRSLEIPLVDNSSQKDIVKKLSQMVVLRKRFSKDLEIHRNLYQSVLKKCYKDTFYMESKKEYFSVRQETLQ